MYERVFSFAILGAIYLLILVVLIAIWISSRKRRTPIISRRLSKLRSRLEQRLVLEALAAFAIERNIDSLLKAVGNRASQLTGYSSWILWLRSFEGKDESFSVAKAGGSLPCDPAILFSLRDPAIDKVVRQNETPLAVDQRFANTGCEKETMDALNAILPGLLIPLSDGEVLIGYIVLGGRVGRERRSEQFLSLFGAFTAIIIKNAMLNAQETRLRQQQMRTEGLSAMGKVAAGVAHEIRNPLTFIRSAAEQLLEPDEKHGDETDLVRGMLEEIDRINLRIEELRSLVKTDIGEFTRLELEKVLDSTVRLVEAKGGIVVEHHNNLEGVTVFGNPDKLRQLFLNLMINGIEAMDKGGKLKLSSYLRNDKAVIEVADTGSGIPQEQIERIFDPFFTTKESGTGLGLALCFSIVAAHGGSLELRQTGPEGTCFAVELPVAGSSAKYPDQDEQESGQQ